MDDLHPWDEIRSHQLKIKILLAEWELLKSVVGGMELVVTGSIAVSLSLDKRKVSSMLKTMGYQQEVVYGVSCHVLPSCEDRRHAISEFRRKMRYER